MASIDTWGNEYVGCSVDFCPSGRNFPPAIVPGTWTCLRHTFVVAGSSLDWDIIGDPETGEDKYLHSGVEYAVKVRTSRVRMKFVATFQTGNPLSWRATFTGEGFGNEFDVAKDSIISIVAV
jgi:hypothetical protein